MLSLDKTWKYPDHIPFEMPHIPVFQSLGTQTNDVQNWHDNQQKVKEDAMLKALKEREKNELMGIGDQSEYMQMSAGREQN